jgi:uncharacterized Fe-S cluster-containing radical SAM superfamily protein
VKLAFPFDPVVRSAETEKLAMKGRRRLYYKFRAAPYYGGIATADAIGCSFLCAYCWNYGRNENPERFGRFYEPEEVAENLLKIARRRNFQLFRVTGSEPILGEASFAHLLQVIGIILEEAPRAKFILETNGLMLGYRDDLAEKLKFRNVLVRVSIKGVDPAFFKKITGAKESFFAYPLLAVKNLESCGVRAWPALMEDLFSVAEINRLKSTIQEHGIKADLELESLEAYPFVVENMRRRGLVLARKSPC